MRNTPIRRNLDDFLMEATVLSDAVLNYHITPH